MTAPPVKAGCILEAPRHHCRGCRMRSALAVWRARSFNDYMAEPTDEQLMAEADRLKQADANKRLPWWPFFYCVLPVLLALGLIVFVNRPGNNDGRPNKPNAVPDLGAQGRPLTKPANVPKDESRAHTMDDGGYYDGLKEPPVKDGTVDPAKDGKTKEPDPTPNPVVSDFEIEITIRNIATGVKNNDPRTVASAQQWLRDNAKNGPVAERITAALTSEQNARIRLALFDAIAGLEPRQKWAMTVYAGRTAKFMGTEENYTEGEIDELEAYFRYLDDPTITTVRQNSFRTEKPLWLLKRFGAERSSFVIAALNDTAKKDPLLPDILELVKRGTAPAEIRENLFLYWMSALDENSALPTEVRDPRVTANLPAFLRVYYPFSPLIVHLNGTKPPEPEQRDHAYLPELLQYIRDLLATTIVDKDLKSQLIAALGNANLRQRPEVTEMINAGLARKDDNYPDYLAFAGSQARTSKDYDLLRSAANDPKPEVARGAIKGLKDAPAGEAADLRLREILNEGTNDGVKADAFAALIERNPRDAQKLVDEYIDPAKPVTLRVVAVAHIPAKDVERLQDLAEDSELKIRQAAINRLGALKDKKLHSFLKRVSTHDTSPVLRQLAAKYAKELE
ncbi:MAG: HEAT repeat domain-containing protein [Planctomycetes bacterium]|nr:HEAT repeat domain-containing protein [Planctomycetota bacterium]